MCKSGLVWFILLFVMSVKCWAVNHTQHDMSKIELKCSINITNYNGVDHASISKKVPLTALKHQVGGTVLVSQTNALEFWAMSHGQQTINGQTFINNFQVAIKDKKTGLFMHALSDKTNSPNKQALKARISLVTYFQDSFLEEGELLFECLTEHE